MKRVTLSRATIAGLALSAVVTLSFPAAPAHAVDTTAPTAAQDLAAVRAKIKAADFTSAVADLNAMVDKGVQHADVYNLLGFSLRKSGDLKNAATYYAKALDFDPAYRGALEYQGELFLQTGQLDRAKQNLASLARLCPQGCEERADLEKALVTAGATPQ